MARPPHREELVRRLAEELAEGAGSCEAGKVGRLINSLRGFVDVGSHNLGVGETLMARVLQLRRANEVLDEFGVVGNDRASWIECLEFTVRMACSWGQAGRWA